MNAAAPQGQATRPSTRRPLTRLVAGVCAVATGIVLVLAVTLGQRIGADGAFSDLVRAVVLRYGATWVALGGVVLLGLRLVGRPPRDPAGRRPAAPVPPGRPQLRLIVSEERR